MTITESYEFNELQSEIDALEVEDLKVGLVINELIEFLSSPSEFRELFIYLSAIRDLLVTNFNHEEVIMNKIFYKSRSAHAKDHNSLLEQLDGLVAILDISRNFSEVDNVLLIQFITKWYARHALHFDGLLHDYLNMLNNQHQHNG